MEYSATDTVIFWVLLVRISANKNSFQALIKV